MKVRSRVFTAKRSEPQAAGGDARRGGSGVAKSRRLSDERCVSYPGRPGQRGKKKAECEKKASDRESAEAIVGEHQTPKGLMS